MVGLLLAGIFSGLTYATGEWTPLLVHEQMQASRRGMLTFWEWMAALEALCLHPDEWLMGAAGIILRLAHAIADS